MGKLSRTLTWPARHRPPRPPGLRVARAEDHDAAPRRAG